MILGDEISRLISTKLTLIKKQINKIINNVEAEDIYSCKQIKSSLPYTRGLGLCCLSPLSTIFQLYRLHKRRYLNYDIRYKNDNY
jgi:hypothetical protein